jgi:membrane protease YdiL (CAAX protease family)
MLGAPAELRGLALVAAFYFVPGWLLRGDPERLRRWQLGPEGPVPPWSWPAARLAAWTVGLLFPVFVVFFFWFYREVCGGETWMLAPVLEVERWTPLAGGLEEFLGRLCRRWDGGSLGGLPGGLRLPASWREYTGLGAPLQIALELFVIALPEEVFHRAYLMSVFEERWPPRWRVFGVPLGFGAALASAVFAVGHLVAMTEVARLATFFPGLLFAWLWRRSGSVWAPALVHAASNLLMAVLMASAFP